MTTDRDPLSLDFGALARAYAAGETTPSAVLRAVLDRADRADPAIWIARIAADDVLARCAALEADGPDGLPLFGIPFAVKDNIDVAGLPTTAGCPDFAYTAERSAPVVQRLLDAGAVLVGKTNLDQFATGLVGVRSPYGVPGNAIDPAYVPGGSSSGSAVAVALGLAAFSLGTDTAGSGRVPAAFNNIVGLKPTRGAFSASGVVPACRTLDCVSVFTLCAADAEAVFQVACAFDETDPFSRPWTAAKPAAAGGLDGLTLGVPAADQLEFFGDDAARELFSKAVERARALGARTVEIDLTPFREAASLLYQGAWVAERYVATRAMVDERPESLLPVTLEIIGAGAKPTAADAFAGQYRLAELRRKTEPVWQTVDMLLTPTAGTIYTIAEVEADPIRLNANLGAYTNFVNLMDLAAISVPAGFRPDGLPFGVTLVAPAFAEPALLRAGDDLHRAADVPMGATGLPLTEDRPAAPAPADDESLIAVCGAHMEGLPLNWQLTDRGGRFVEATKTAPVYRFYAFESLSPIRPGLVRSDGVDGGAIEVEVWALPAAEVGGFLAGIAAPLGLGQLLLADGREVTGFICESYAAAAAREITALGGWRAFLDTRNEP